MRPHILTKESIKRKYSYMLSALLLGVICCVDPGGSSGSSGPDFSGTYTLTQGTVTNAGKTTTFTYDGDVVISKLPAAAQLTIGGVKINHSIKFAEATAKIGIGTGSAKTVRSITHSISMSDKKYQDGIAKFTDGVYSESSGSITLENIPLSAYFGLLATTDYPASSKVKFTLKKK